MSDSITKIIFVESAGYHLSNYKMLTFTPSYSIGEGTDQRRFLEFVLKRKLTEEELLGFDPNNLIGMEFDYDEWTNQSKSSY